MNNQYTLTELISLIREVKLLTESALDVNDITQMKYFIPFVEKIKKGDQFFLEPKPGEEPTTYFTIDVSKEEGQNFLQALIDTNAERDKLESLFKTPSGKMKDVIPASDNNTYKLNQLGKGVFTAKFTKGGLQGTETSDMKEGLVCYFILVGTDGIEKVENKLKSKSDITLDLPIQIINDTYFGKKSARLIKNGITYLNENQLKDKKEIGFYLNAISAAKTCLTFNMNVVDRGNLFESIRSVASKITMIEPDKWCPGDIYLYNADSKGQIDKILVQSSELNNVISVVEDGKIKEVGLNQLFEGDSPLIYAISLKEEESLSGRATAFLNVKNLQGKELAAKTFKFQPEEIQILKIYKDRKIPNANDLIPKYEAEKNENKQIFIDAVASFGLNATEGIRKKKSKKEMEPEQKLGNLVSKSACYRFMKSYFNEFDKLKQTNDIMSKYDNPMLALTAFGVSLSGFNPTFKKVVGSADGSPASITIFKGRDSLSITAKECSLFDSPEKAGINFSFLTMMGEKNYKTTLDIRFAGGWSVSIIVDEFHEE